MSAATTSSLSEEQTRNLDAAIDRLFPDALSLLQAMVATKSINPLFPGIDRASVIGGETACGALWGDWLRNAGLAIETVAPDPERVNTVAIMKGTGGGRSLIVNGHIDTVAAFTPEEWITGNPWKPEIRDGRLYGLGSTDMKSGVVAAALAAAALKQAGITTKGDVQLHAVVGEETMSHELGTSAVLNAGYTADAAIVVEPTAQPDPLTIATVGAGNFNLQIVVQGYGTHCGNRGAAIRAGGLGPGAGVNAVEKAILIVQAMQQLEQEWGVTKSHPDFPAGFFSLLPGVFHGDVGVPSVGYMADQATIGYLVWYPPANTAEEIKAEIEAQIRAACQLDPWLRENPPEIRWDSNWPVSEISRDHALVRQMVRDRADVFGPPPPGVADTSAFHACCDSAFLQAKGIPTVIFGPGNLRCAHAINEFVNVDEVRDAARILARTMANWCEVA